MFHCRYTVGNEVTSCLQDIFPISRHGMYSSLLYRALNKIDWPTNVYIPWSVNCEGRKNKYCAIQLLITA